MSGKLFSVDYALHRILNAHKKKKCEPTTRGRKKDLRQAVLGVLDRYQDVSQLLQEIQTDVRSGTTGPSADDGIHVEEGTDINIAVNSITSCLQQQATLTGVPVSQLAAKKCAPLFKDIIASDQSKELSTDQRCLSQAQRVKLQYTISLIKRLSSQHMFHRKQFAEAFNSISHISGQHKSTHIEVIWQLHTESIMPFDLFLTFHLADQPTLFSVATDVAGMCLEAWEAESQEERDRATQIFLDLTVHLIQHTVYPDRELVSDQDHGGIREAMQQILSSIFEKVFEAACKTSQEIDCHERVLPIRRMKALVSTDGLQQFAVLLLSQLLCLNPDLSVTDAFSKQQDWSFAKSPPCITSLFRQLLSALQPNEAVGLLRRVLDHEEVNWKSTLAYTSTMLIYIPEAQDLVKKCISDFLEQAMESYEEELMICALLLVRQAANEGPGVFPSYAAWFKETFCPGQGSASAITSKKAFTFLVDFLTNLVPYETAGVLRAHVQNPPAAPAKCQDVWRDYQLLAKTRLSDLNESWQSSDIPGAHKPLMGSRSSKPQDAKGDVELSVESFEANNRIPTNVLEISIFKRPYYLAHFLPTLLTPRMLPDIADGKMKLIEALKNANKIPSGLYQQYEDGCAKELNELLDGAFSEDVMEDCMEPLEAVTVGLTKLQATVSGWSGNEDDRNNYLGELSAQVTVLCDKVSVALGLDAPPSQHSSDLSSAKFVDLKEAQHSPAQKQVAEVLLDSFGSICREVGIVKQTTRCVAMATKMAWSHQMACMLSRFPDLCSSLYHRVWAMVCQQGSTLSNDAVVGITCFLYQTHILMSMFPSVLGDQTSGRSEPGCSLLEAICAELSVTTSQQMLFTARFTSMLMLHSLHHSPPGETTSHVSDGTPKMPLVAVEKFLFLIPRLCPQMRELDETMSPEDNSQADDPLLEVGRSLCASQIRSSLMPTNQLTFQRWISYELTILPHEDCLNDLDRHDYHQWAVLCHFTPLPTPQGGCGGSHRQACVTLINGLLDHVTGADQSRTDAAEQEAYGKEGTSDAQAMQSHTPSHTISHTPSHTPRHDQFHPHSCWRELLQSLQELIPWMDQDQVDRHDVSGDLKSHDSWLLSILHDRLSRTVATSGGVSSQSDVCFSRETVEIQAFVRLFCCIPPYLLFTRHIHQSPTQDSLAQAAQLINKHLRAHCMETWCSLPYISTAHLLKGLLMVASATQDGFLQPFLVACPLLSASILYHWGRLHPFIVRSYPHKPLPAIFQQMKDLHVSADETAKNAKHHLASSSSSSSSSSSTQSSLSVLSIPTSSKLAASLARVCVTVTTPPWICAMGVHLAVRRVCREGEERSRVMTGVWQMVAMGNQDRDRMKIGIGLMDCHLAEGAWGLLTGRSWQQQHQATSQLILQHVPLLLQLIAASSTDSSVLQSQVASHSAVQLYHVVIMKSLLPARSQIQTLLSHHPLLMDVLLSSHNALWELYCRAGGEQPQQQKRGIRKSIRVDKTDVLSADMMLSCTRFIQHSILVCPPSALRNLKQGTLAGCNEEHRAAIRNKMKDKS